MEDLTGFQRDCLYVIAGLDAPKGTRIKEELGEYRTEKINHGRLYPNLDDLVNIGLINKDEKDKRTNEYTLTHRGRQELEARREWESQYVDLGE